MKKKLFLGVIFSSALFTNAQQVIGHFPIMDGGMESQTATATIPTAGSSQAGTAQTTWTVSSSTNASTRIMANDAALARSGTFSAAIAINPTKTNLRLQSPSTVTPALQTATLYTVQFFYNTTVDPGVNIDGGIYLNNTTGGVAVDLTSVTPFAANTWVKGHAPVTSGGTFNASNWAAVRLLTTAAGEYTATVRIDDFVVYPGAYDNVAPTTPTATTPYAVAGGQTTLNWTAAADATDVTNGIINGGYVVVRYPSMPAADNNPNQNGIYKVGNTTANGTAGLVGTVVYIGTALTFSEASVTGAYYKIYAVDKAFNYSTAAVVAPALSVASNNLESIKLYPNPANNQLFFDTNNLTINSVSIYGVDGKLVKQQNDLNNNSINISDLTSGVFFVKIASEEGTITKRIIKN